MNTVSMENPLKLIVPAVNSVSHEYAITRRKEKNDADEYSWHPVGSDVRNACARRGVQQWA
jgi:hypothetical protein